MNDAGVRELAPPLGTLEGAGMIELAQTDPDLEYLFRHVLIQEAAYESLLRQDRQRLHAVVADCMEELFGERLDELAAVMAMHLDAAGDSARAVDYFVRAGRFALSRFAGHEAVEAFVRARALIPDGDVDPDTRRLRAEVDLGTVEAGITFIPGDKDLAMLGRAREDAETLDDAALLTRVFLLIAVVRTGRGDQYATSPELREAIDRGIASADRSGDAAHRTEALAILGEARYGSADYEEAIRLLEEAASRFEADGRTAWASLARGTLGLAHARLGRFDEAEAQLARSERLARDSADPTALLDADLYRAILETLRGRREIAIDFAVRAADAADRLDNKACALVARSVIGEQRLLLGQPEAAIVVLEESADLAAYCNMAPARVEFTRALLESARAQCSGPVTVPDRLDAALEYARISGDRLAEGEILRQRARDRARCGAIDAALADYAAAEEVFRSLMARPDLAQTLDEHAAASAAAGREGEAAKISAESATVRATMTSSA
ncbi:hypothetical protein BH20CHL7_BH20CHL7_05920 [soil metagenome]